MGIALARFRSCKGVKNSKLHTKWVLPSGSVEPNMSFFTEFPSAAQVRLGLEIPEIPRYLRQLAESGRDCSVGHGPLSYDRYPTLARLGID